LTICAGLAGAASAWCAGAIALALLTTDIFVVGFFDYFLV